MAEKSGVPYVDSSFNPVWGCTPCSMSCERCYAAKMARIRFRMDCFGKGKKRKTFGEVHWREPLKWDIKAGLKHVTPTVLCGDMCDIFDPEWPDDIRPKLWELIEDTPRLYWLLLTKRIENAESMLPEKWLNDGFPMNVGMGVTIEHRKYVAERLELLCKLPAYFRWISAEPLLSDLKLELNNLIHWVIIGCDSSTVSPLPTRIEWIKNVLRECKKNSILSYVKQVSIIKECKWSDKYGDYVRCSKKIEEWPEEVKVQEMPNFRMIKIGRK
jgi:protein gp37